MTVLDKTPVESSTGGRPSITVAVSAVKRVDRIHFAEKMYRVALAALADFDLYAEIKMHVDDETGGITITLNDQISHEEHPIFKFILNRFLEQLKADKAK